VDSGQFYEKRKKQREEIMRRFLMFLLLLCVLMGVSPFAEATLSNSNSRTTLAADGATDDFDFTFKILDTSQVDVYLVEDANEDNAILQTLTTDYTVTLSSTTEGGTVSFVTTPSTTFNVTMIRDVPYTQPTDLPVNAGFSERTLENAYDRIVMQTQQLYDLAIKTVRLPTTSSLTAIELPSPEDGNVLVWAGTDGTLENQIYSTTALDAAVASAEAAQAAAETAETNAETAETNAETAETNAETAETNAEAAQVAAEAAVALINAEIHDADDDTSVTTEPTADADTIVFTTAGSAEMTITSSGVSFYSGAVVDEFSTDGTFAGNSNTAVPTEAAVVTYVNGLITTGSQSFTEDGTFTVPAGIYNIWVTLVGGGGSGSDGINPQAGGGGAASLIKQPYLVTPAEELAVVIGQGGAGSTGNGNNGTASTFGTGTRQLVADYGNGAVGNTPGAAGTLYQPTTEQDGTYPEDSSTYRPQQFGMNGIIGGTGKSTPDGMQGGGGSTVFGVGGAETQSDTGNAGVGYGSGGSGSLNGTSGAGKNGIAIIDW